MKVVRTVRGAVDVVWTSETRSPIRLRLNAAQGTLEVRNDWETAQVPLTDLFGQADSRRVASLLAAVHARAKELDARRDRNIASWLRSQVRRRDGNRCRWCGREGTAKLGPDNRAWHIDHVKPVAHGGLDEISNLVLSCARCNLAKSDDDWGEPLRVDAGVI